MTLSRLLFVFSTLIFLNSCSTDIDVAADWKDIPVVYSILNSTDSTHYVRIQRAYLDEKTSALVYAPIADSNYYGTITPVMERWKKVNTIDTKLETFPMVINNSFPKDSGLFAHPAQAIYSFTANLDKDSEYKIVFKTPKNVDIVAKTNIVADFQVIPFPNIRTFNFSAIGSQTMRLYSPQNGYMHDAYIRLHYYEWDKNATVPDTLKKVIRMNIYNGLLFGNTIGGQSVDIKLNGKDVFSQLKIDVPINNQVKRLFNGVEYVVGVGNIELSNYIQVNGVNNSLLAQKPVYTNIPNGFGIFSSRKIVPNLEIETKKVRYPYTSTTFIEAKRFEGMDSLISRYPELNFIR